jgi:D-alanyl-D-alanine dipeptidase
MIDRFVLTPISFNYTVPTTEKIAAIKSEDNVVAFPPTPGLILAQSYFKVPYSGTSAQTFTRSAVAKRIASALQMLAPQYGIIVFDAFRSIETQRALFQDLSRQIAGENPDLTSDELYQATRKFVVDPDVQVKGRPVTPPHNSGGAIDLALHENGNALDFGTGFDSPSEVSATAFFDAEFDRRLGYTEERWHRVRSNRRLLFHTMAHLGFTNYRDEWWHYDLGDGMWAAEFKTPKLFDSMESAVLKILFQSQPGR